MNQDEIIEMAKTIRSSGYWDAFDLINFAKLVADSIYENEDMFTEAYAAGYVAGVAAERQACAKLIEPDEEHRRDASWGYLGGDEGVELLDGAAAKIRARGET